MGRKRLRPVGPTGRKAILGMSRAEIRKKFDEIVAFAEVEKFLDTPVKRYSSGMYVRLAFAVAAHLEPEILIVDEVLAVGDAEFPTDMFRQSGRTACERNRWGRRSRDRDRRRAFDFCACKIGKQN